MFAVDAPPERPWTRTVQDRPSTSTVVSSTSTSTSAGRSVEAAGLERSRTGVGFPDSGACPVTAGVSEPPVSERGRPTEAGCESGRPFFCCCASVMAGPRGCNGPSIKHLSLVIGKPTDAGRREGPERERLPKSLLGAFYGMASSNSQNQARREYRQLLRLHERLLSDFQRAREELSAPDTEAS